MGARGIFSREPPGSIAFYHLLRLLFFLYTKMLTLIKLCFAPVVNLLLTGLRISDVCMLVIEYNVMLPFSLPMPAAAAYVIFAA